MSGLTEINPPKTNDKPDFKSAQRRTANPVRGSWRGCGAENERIRAGIRPAPAYAPCFHMKLVKGGGNETTVRSCSPPPPSQTRSPLSTN